MSTASAVATNMLVVTSLSMGSMLRFRQAGVVLKHPTLGLVLLSVPGSVLGAYLAVRMSELTLRTVIAMALVAMAFVLALQPNIVAARPRSRQLRAAGYAALAVWAIYGGMFSGGYATLLTLGGTAFFGLRLIDASRSPRS